LDSRLFILTALLPRARGAESLIFVETRGGTSRHYVGIAEIDDVRSALGQEAPYLEAAFIAGVAHALEAWWPLSVPEWSPRSAPVSPTQTDRITASEQGATRIALPSGAFEPRETMERIMSDFLETIRILQPPSDDPPKGWVKLRNESGAYYWECATWIHSGSLQTRLGDLLRTTAINERPNGAVSRSQVTLWHGSIVPVVDAAGRFVKAVDRVATLEASDE
jgi:hypothetical protein